ncbi:FGGY-family carbohydrate kinase [Streptomyces sp. NPDC052236]|uniref:FGGY-family carbohydrate kinase n=1 Tax=Streptomyces sp. NPDC052236 TaxID=3365686 RepID=UPI0037D63E10
MTVTTGAAQPADTAWLGIDVGTQGARAVVVDSFGVLLGRGSAPLSRAVQRSGVHHEQDPRLWWSALCAATRAATASLGGRRGRPLGALAIDSTSGTVLVQDRAGAARGPALMYDDGRAAVQARRVQEAGEQVWSSLGYRIQRTWALPKVCWLLDQGAVGDGDTVVHQADHLAARLTGHTVATDTSHALKTGYDLVRLTWPQEVLAALRVPAGVLPSVVAPGTVLGTVSQGAAAQTGIPEGTPVKAGMTDGCAAQISARALTPGAWTSALGTTLVVKGCTAELLKDPSGVVYCHRNPDGGWLPGGASSTGAGVIAREFAGADLDDLTRCAAARDPEPAPGVTYPLTGTGERFPFLAAEATGFREGVSDDPVVRFAGVLQGIAFLERLAYDVLGGLGADTTGPMTFSGGATRNHYWNQLRADVLGRPALLPSMVEAALGMAVLAAAPPGRLARTAESMVRVKQVLEPDNERGARFEDAYDRFRTRLVDRGWLDARWLVAAHHATKAGDP